MKVSDAEGVQHRGWSDAVNPNAQIGERVGILHQKKRQGRDGFKTLWDVWNQDERSSRYDDFHRAVACNNLDHFQKTTEVRTQG